jgi:hypothetical protein
MEHFEFKLSFDEWTKIKPYYNGKRYLMTDNWTNVFCDNFAKFIYSCVIICTGHRANAPEKVGGKTAYMRGYANCKRPPCERRYTFSVLKVPKAGENVTVHVR